MCALSCGVLPNIRYLKPLLAVTYFCQYLDQRSYRLTAIFSCLLFTKRFSQIVLFNGPSPNSFLFLVFFKQTLKFFQQINVKNDHPVYSAGIQTYDHYESHTITTRPGLPPSKKVILCNNQRTNSFHQGHVFVAVSC